MKYTVDEIQQFMKTLANIFDIVRLVNVEQCREIGLDSQGKVFYKDHCYQAWNKRDRCENCISFKASRFNKRMTKFEFIDEAIFYVLAIPVQLVLKDGSPYPCVLEIVSKNSDEVLIGAFGKNEFIENIMNYQKKLHEDSLTKGYNRRYFDERAFCYSDCGGDLHEMVFIATDLKDFKRINDLYGHLTGDSILIQAVQLIQKNIRKEDAVIRMGGDEFLIVLKRCNLKVADRIISQIADGFEEELCYDSEQNLYATLNFGLAYTSEFDCSDECITRLYEEADHNMYLQKHSAEI